MNNPRLVELGEGYRFDKDHQPEHNGRPKGSRSMTSILRGLVGKEMTLKNPMTGQTEVMTVGEIIQLQKVARAMKGDLKAIEMVDDRLDGKPVQPMENTGIDKIIIEVIKSGTKNDSTVAVVGVGGEDRIGGGQGGGTFDRASGGDAVEQDVQHNSVLGEAVVAREGQSIDDRTQDGSGVESIGDA
jgi:hypothetical protein